ncbi:MAG: ATP-dependent zinc metalloprotease FtsH [Acidimicrobiales bacterium]
MSKKEHKASKSPEAPSRWRSPVLWVALAIPVLLALYAGLMVATLPSSAGQQVNFSVFAQDLQDGQVSSATLLNVDNRVLFMSQGHGYWTSLPDNAGTNQSLFALALKNHVPFNVDQQSFKYLILPATYIVPALMFMAVIILMWLLLRPGGGAFLRARARRAKKGDVTFADVAGLDEAVLELQEVREYLAHPERFATLGAKVPRGILLVGPPGTGKTLLARGVAGVAGAGFFSISGADFVELYVGVGASRVRDLFRQARDSAPSILFIDELDAVGRTRTGLTAGGDERDQTLNQLLVEMDGFERSSGVVLIGATNRPDVLDPAIIRRGRFDRQIVVDRPDKAGRMAILAVHARDKPLDPSVSLDSLAAHTAGLTGADLAAVLNEAALLAGRRSATSIGEFDLEDALDRVVEGTTRRGQPLDDNERRIVAHHEAGHALVAWALPGAPAVSKISIVARGQTLGQTWHMTEEPRPVVTRSQLEANMAVLLGGVAAEERLLGEPTTGPSDDLKRATRIARRMVCELGMSEKLGRGTLAAPGAGYLGDAQSRLDCSPEVEAEVDREVRQLLDAAFNRASAALAANAMVLDGLVGALVERETLREPELVPFVAAVAGAPNVGAANVGVAGQDRALRAGRTSG